MKHIKKIEKDYIKSFNFPEIEVKDIPNASFLFLSGATDLAYGIKQTQYRMYEKGDKSFKYWFLNHVGVHHKLNNDLCVGEEDYPGRFQLNLFKDKYIDGKADVFCGIIKDWEISEYQLKKQNKEFINLASEDVLLDYSYWDILAFKVNQLTYRKKTKKGLWIGTKKNKKSKYTCSQRACDWAQRYPYYIMLNKNVRQCYPVELATNKNVVIYKIKY